MAFCSQIFTYNITIFIGYFVVCSSNFRHVSNDQQIWPSASQNNFSAWTVYDRKF